jgi:HTH-type transcriptional regulator/antitoxin HigA
MPKIRSYQRYRAALVEIERLFDLTRRDLEPYIGSRARVAEVLNHKRPLSLEMIRRLNQVGIAAEVLIRPYKVKAAA